MATIKPSSEDSSSLTDEPGFYTPSIFILFFLSLIIALENFLVLISVGIFTFKKYSINPFICSLSLADILHFFGPVLISFHIYISDRPQGFQQQYALCKAQSWMTGFLHMTSMLSILMLAIDRNLSLTKPIFYKRKWKGLLLVVVVVACWMLSAFLSSWQMLSKVVEPTRFAPHIYCLFTADSSFAISFASLHLFLIIVCVISVIYSTSSSRNSLFRAEYSSATGKIKVEKTRNLVQEEYSRKMTRMVSIVVCLYCIAHLPWMVAIFLGYFNVTYPPIYGVLSLQFPMVSGLCNPLIYGLVWPPFRNAYVNTMKAPLRICKGKTRNIRSHSFQDLSLSRSYSYWSPEGFNPVTAGQQGSSLQVLFGPSSHSNQPLDFMPDELRIFENEGLTVDSISLEVVGSDVTQDVTNDDKISTAATNIALDASGQFQSILDLIEEMTEGKSRANCSSKKGKSQSIDSKESSGYWSADKSSTHVPSQNGGTSSSTDGTVAIVDTHSWLQDQQGSVRSGIAGCVCRLCIGKSKRYVIDKNRNRCLDYTVAREDTEINDPSNEGVMMNRK